MLVVVAWYALSVEGGAARAPHDVVHFRDSAAQTASVAQAAAPRRAKARDADQAYLRALADHLEEQRTLAHAMMSTPASHMSHGSATDPSNWDGIFDNHQREAVALLKHDYREVLSPRAGVAGVPGASPGGQAEAAEQASMRSLVAAMRECLVLTNRFLPRLRRASTRDLARRVRASHVELIKSLDTPTGH